MANENKKSLTRNIFVNAGWYSVKDLERMIQQVKDKQKDSYQYVRYQGG